MSNILKNYGILLIVLLFPFMAIAQIGIEDEARILQELKKRGIDERELNTLLLENGINPDSLEYASPSELARIQALIENLDADKKETERKSDLPLDKKDIIPAVTLAEDNSKSDDLFPANIEYDSTLIYGHQFFKAHGSRTESPLLINEAYILGSGDVISVSIWSQNAKFDNSFVVNNNGYIRLTDASQRIYVRGLELSEARNKIKSRLKQFYRFNEGEFSLSIESARNINISVFGEVQRPGGLNFSAALNVIDALRLAGGLTENGSVRHIKMISAKGLIRVFDLYAYLHKTDASIPLFLQDGDVLHVPYYSSTVDLEGAVRRPGKYEIIEGQGLNEIINIAGGFEQNANKSIIQIERFTQNAKRIFDVDLSRLLNEGQDLELKNGDIISIKSLSETANNYVVVQGEVIHPGRFEREEGMKMTDLLVKAGIKPESKTDFAFLKRQQLDGTGTYLRLNLDEIIAQPASNANLVLLDRDTLTVWAKRRFVDDGTFEVEGAIRFPGEYQYDYSQKIYFSDALLLAGGKSRDASNIAFIHRSDPLRPNDKQYIRVNIDNLDTLQMRHENLVLEPFDRIEVLSKNLFTERTTVKISGPVNNPGEFQYGNKMSLKDLVILAGGFKLGASSQNIEISRVMIRDNKPTVITIAKVTINTDFGKEELEDEAFILEPYDHVKVRYVPEFEFQQDVEIYGEVLYPGIYTLANKNEKIADIIKKAGGFTEEAFVDGATLFRNEDSLGYIVLNLGDAMEDQDSRYNFILKGGDLVEIPKMKDFVSIRGATKANEIYGDKLLKNPKGINVPFHKSKNAGYYIKKYTGGLADNASKKNIFVEHPNGEIEKTKTFLTFTFYPEVRKGSIIKVGKKAVKTEDGVKNEKEVDWSKVISDSLAQAMTIFTLILLARQATN